MDYFNLLMGNSIDKEEKELQEKLKKEYTELTEKINKALKWFDSKAKIDKDKYVKFYKEIFKLNIKENELKEAGVKLSEKERCYGFEL